MRLAIGFLVLGTSVLLLAAIVLYNFSRSESEVLVALSETSGEADLKLNCMGIFTLDVRLQPGRVIKLVDNCSISVADTEDGTIYSTCSLGKEMTQFTAQGIQISRTGSPRHACFIRFSECY